MCNTSTCLQGGVPMLQCSCTAVHIAYGEHRAWSMRGEGMYQKHNLFMILCQNADLANFSTCCRDKKTIYVTFIEMTIQPLEIPLTKGRHVLLRWLDLDLGWEVLVWG